MERNYDLLLKSKWYAKDIQAFYGCSLTYANDVKTMVEKKYGAIPMDENKKERAVAADNVIRILGGVDRLTEAQIYKNIRGDKNNG